MDFKDDDVCPFAFDLTPKDWSEIKSLAVKILDKGTFEKDEYTHLRCSIAAFLWWSEKNQIIAEIQRPEKGQLH